MHIRKITNAEDSLLSNQFTCQFSNKDLSTSNAVYIFQYTDKNFLKCSMNIIPVTPSILTTNGM